MNIAMINGKPMFDGNTVFGSMLALYEAYEAGQFRSKEDAVRFAQGYVERMEQETRKVTSVHTAAATDAGVDTRYLKVSADERKLTDE